MLGLLCGSVAKLSVSIGNGCWIISVRNVPMHRLNRGKAESWLTKTEEITHARKRGKHDDTYIFNAVTPQERLKNEVL